MNLIVEIRTSSHQRVRPPLAKPFQRKRRCKDKLSHSYDSNEAWWFVKQGISSFGYNYLQAGDVDFSKYGHVIVSVDNIPCRVLMVGQKDREAVFCSEDLLLQVIVVVRIEGDSHFVLVYDSSHADCCDGMTGYWGEAWSSYRGDGDVDTTRLALGGQRKRASWVWIECELVRTRARDWERCVCACVRACVRVCAWREREIYTGNSTFQDEKKKNSLCSQHIPGVDREDLSIWFNSKLQPTCRKRKIPPVRTSGRSITSTGTYSPLSFSSRISTQSSIRRITSCHLRTKTRKLTTFTRCTARKHSTLSAGRKVKIDQLCGCSRASQPYDKGGYHLFW